MEGKMEGGDLLEVLRGGMEDLLEFELGYMAMI